MNKKVSVIIPTLNEEKLVEKLLRQFDDNIRKRFDLELIVSDGGSIDGTLDICRRYADKVVEKDSCSKQNISRGRNIGAWQSQGDVLIFLNADVVLHNPVHILDEAVRCINGLNVAIACRVEVNESEQILSDRIFHGIYNRYVQFLNSTFFGMGRGECQIVGRRAFVETGGYDEKLAAGEDFELFNRLRRRGRVIFRDDFLVYESPRRYRKYGYGRVLFDWARNSLSVLFLKRSISKSWDPVR